MFKTLLLLPSLLLCIFTSFTSSASVIPNVPHVYVEGFAEMDVAPDQIKFSLMISETQLVASDAKQKVEVKLSKLLSLLTELNIEKKDVTASGYQISPSYDWRDGKREYQGTDVSTVVYVLLRDIKAYPQVMNAFVNAEITSIVNSQALLSNEREIKQQVLKLALTNARARANDLAALQQKSVKDVHSISEFNTRDNDRYNLVPNQSISGNSMAKMSDRIEVSGMRSSDANLEIGTMKAEAIVYVVYTLE